MSAPKPDASRLSKAPEAVEPHSMDPVALLKGLVSLRRLTGLYPSGHPAIEQKLAELDDTLQRHIRVAAALRIDVIHGAAHIDGVPYRQDSDAQSQVLRELTDLGIDSIKKAQLFGELSEYFEVQVTEELSLDDFPTLRHVMNFLAGVPRKPAR